MNSNSLTRIKYLLLQDLSMNRKRYISLVVGLFLGALMLIYLAYPSYLSHDDSVDYIIERFYEAVYDSMPVFIVCATLVFISELFANFSTKQKRVHQLMLPATKGEKFAARFLLCCVGFPIVFLVAITLADVARWILSPLLFENTLPLIFHKLIPDMLLKTTFYWEGETLDHFLFCAFMTWIATFYAMGSALFRRRALLKSTLCLMGGFILLVLFMENFDVPGMSLDDDFFDIMRFFLSCIMLVLSVVQFYLTRYLYNRIQVISKQTWYDRI
jgi:hypothetical protein